MDKKKQYLIILLYIMLTIAKQFFFQLQSGISDFRGNGSLFFSIIAISIITASFFPLFKPYASLKYILAASIIVSAFIYSDIMYFRYYNNVITIPLVKQLGSVDSISDSVYSLVHFKDFLLFADMPFFIGLLLYYRKKNNVTQVKSKKPLAVSVSLALTGAIFLVLALNAVSGFSFRYDNIFMISRMGIGYFRIVNTAEFINDSLFNKDILDENELELIEETIANSQESFPGYFGISEGKNLIILQLEAIQQFVIDLKINGHEVTPNLNRFKERSVYLNNIYYQTAGGNTSDAEFLTNAALFPAPEGATFILYPDNKYHSLANMLKAEDYVSYSFHANDAAYWNRTEMHRSLGFDTFFSETDFIIDEVIGWGLSDASFYKQVFNKINTASPFYAFIISLSSHYPYDFFSDYDFNTDGIDDELLSNYLKAANYADMAFGIFLDQIEKKGLLDKSLILIYGDHQAIPRNSISSFEALFGHEISELEWLTLQKVPAFIYDSKLTPRVFNKTGGQINFMPTILNLLGIQPVHSIGKNMFSNEQGYSVLRNGSVITDYFYYISAENKVYDSSGKELDLDLYIDEIHDLQQDLEASDLIVESDYFANN